MNLSFKTAKCILIIYFLLISFIFIVPSNMAKFGDIYTCQSIVEIDYDANLTNQPLLPIDAVLKIPLEIKYYVQGQYADYITDVYLSMGLDAFIYLEIKSTPEWCDATISPSVLIMPATTEGSFESANLSIKINRETQAFDAGDIAVKFIVTRMGAISQNTIIKNVSFTVGYLPVLDIEIPGGAVKSISPDETATFDIEIENIGNGKTNVSLRVIDAPDDWVATIPSCLLIDSKDLSENNKRTVQLDIKPPCSFGYHNEKETITVAIKPTYFKDDTVQGEEYYLTFIVKNKGFSTPGFEVIYVLVGLIIVLLIVKRKNSFYKGGGAN